MCGAFLFMSQKQSSIEIDERAVHIRALLSKPFRFKEHEEYFCPKQREQAGKWLKTEDRQNSQMI